MDLFPPGRGDVTEEWKGYGSASVRLGLDFDQGFLGWKLQDWKGVWWKGAGNDEEEGRCSVEVLMQIIPRMVSFFWFLSAKNPGTCSLWK